MPLVMEGADDTTREALQDALRAGLLRGRVEINLYNEDGVCRTEPCREALAGEDVVVVNAKVVVSGGDYSIAVELYRQDRPDERTKFENECPGCAASDVGDLIAELAAEFIASVDVEDEPVDPEGPPVAGPDPMPEDVPEDKKQLRPLWGWLALGGGVALAGGGATLIALDGREHKPSCSDDQIDINGLCPNVWTTQGAGIGLLAGGVALIGTGAALLVLSYKRRKNGRETMSLRLVPAARSLTLIGRF